MAATANELEARWGLDVGPPFDPGGQCAWVAAARDAHGNDVVLKLGWRHFEAEHEPDGLRCWAGDGAVVLHRSEAVDDQTVALLLERCLPGSPLSDRPEPAQDIVVAGLLRRLWVEPRPGHPFRDLQTMCDAWADEFEDKTARRGSGLDPGLARAAIELFRGLPGSADRHVLLSTDLHAGNVLAAQRGPWLAIDPKPYVGDPAYDVLQHLLGCQDRLRTDPCGLGRRLADLAGLDADRVLLWLFARCVQESPDNPWMEDVARRLAGP